MEPIRQAHRHARSVARPYGVKARPAARWSVILHQHIVSDTILGVNERRAAFSRVAARRSGVQPAGFGRRRRHVGVHVEDVVRVPHSLEGGEAGELGVAVDPA